MASRVPGPGGQTRGPRLALAGTGWAGRVHTLAAAATGVDLVAVADRTEALAAPLAGAIDRRPVDVEALPAGADAVVLATPATGRAALATRLLGAGVPVLIETPVAATPAEADAIVAASEASGAAACYAENLVFAPAVELAMARRAALGPLDHLEVRLSQPPPAADGDRLAAGGVLAELGVHAVAWAVLLATGDEPVAVRARLGSSRPDGVDDVARIELRFGSDLIAALDVDWAGDVPAWSAQVAAPTGVVRVELQPQLGVEVDGEPVAVPTPGGSGVAAELDPRVTDLGFAAQLDGFRSVVAGRGGRVCPAGFGRAMLEIVCAAALSAGHDGEEVPLPYAGPRDLTPLQLWRTAP